MAGTGPQHEIVVSSRVRLARNVASYPFMSKANRLQRAELHKMCREQLLNMAGGTRATAAQVAVVGGAEKKEDPVKLRQQEISRLRKDLARAVEDESYEVAAKLRDQIRKMEGE